MTCVGHCEIDKFAHATYQAIHDVKEDGFYAADIRTIAPAELPAADIWAFGFPCQAFSCAGQRQAFADMRGTLIFEILRLAAARKPQVLFDENVEGLLTVDGGRVFSRILDAMGELGYFIEWQCINSAAFVPQNRPRVYIVGHLGGPPARAVFPVVPSDAQHGVVAVGLVNSQGKFKQHNRIYSPAGLCPCLDTTTDRPAILQPDGQVRWLSALEKFRLQGFDDADYERAAAVCSNTQLHKQMGNCVTVPVIAEIGRRIALAYEE